MLIFNTNTKRNTIILIKEIPSYIKIQSNSPGLAHFNDSCEHSIGCIGCPNPRCIHFSPREIECDFVEGFSCDKSTNVCPVDAIYSDPYGMPVIDNQKCISCGICVSRCPIGALYFSSDGTLMLDSGTFSINSRSLLAVFSGSNLLQAFTHSIFSFLLLGNSPSGSLVE